MPRAGVVHRTWHRAPRSRLGVAPPVRDTRVARGALPRRPPDPPASPNGAGVPGRRTVTITGLGSGAISARRGPAPAIGAGRTATRTPAAPDSRPDRAAMWAVMLGALLILVAASSSHAAMLRIGAGRIAARCTRAPAPIVC